MPERMIAELCSPTLFKVKCANLFNCEYETKESLIRQIQEMNARLASKGIHMMILGYPSKGRALIYIFRPSMLQSKMDEPETRELMEELGYKDHRIGNCLNVLRDKFSEHSEFPHEIGCFLGYPCVDVKGFMNNEPCTYHGVWKVYGDVEKAKELFELYDTCTKKCVDEFDNGMSLEEIAVA